MTKIYSLILVLVGAFVIAQTPEPPPGPAIFPPRKGTFLVLPVEVIDGDTVRFYWLVEDVGRLMGINAPELHGADAVAGKAAKDFLTARLSFRLTKCTILGKEKYGRSLIDLFDERNISYSKIMVDSGHAKTWDGKGVRP